MKNLISAILLLILSVTVNVNISSAQWEQIGPFGGSLSIADSYGDKIYAGGGWSDRIFRYMKNEDTWIQVVKFDNNLRGVGSIEVTETAIFACTYRELFGTESPTILRSTNGGVNWSVSDNGISYSPNTFDVSVSLINGYLFTVVPYSGMYRSSNNGDYWSGINNGLTENYGFSRVVSNGTYLFILAGYNKLYRSSNNGDSWSFVYNLPSLPFTSVESSGTNLLIATEGNGILKSSDNGNSWIYSNNGLSNLNVRSLKLMNSGLYAGTNSGPFYSVDNGNSWSAVNGLSGLIENWLESSSEIFAFSSGSILKSTNNGINWENSSNGINMKYITSFTSNDQYLFTGTYWGELFRTSNNGLEWEMIDKVRDNGDGVGISMATKDNYIFCSGEYGGLYRSTNNGDNWNLIINGLGGYYGNGYLYSDSEYIYTGYNGNLFRSSNYGDIWIAVSNGLTHKDVSVLISTGANLFSFSSGGVFRSSDNGDNWTISNNGINGKIENFSYNGSYLFAAGANGVFRSSDNGENWIAVNNGFVGLNATSIASSGSKIFVGNNLGIFYSNNNGIVWNLINDGINSPIDVNRLIIKNDQVFAGMLRSSVYKRSVSDFPQQIVLNDIGVSNIPVPAMNMINYLNCDSNFILNPKVEVANFGLNNQSNSFAIIIEIRSNGELFYSDIRHDTLSAGLTRVINFNPIMYPQNTTEKNFTVKSWSVMANDTNHNNDTANSSFTITNINFGGGLTSNFGYYFSNSTPGAGCSPDQPLFYWEDTTGSVNLIANGIAQLPLSGGNLNDGYFLLKNILPQGQKFQFNGICYDTFGISTNGIISLGSNTVNLSSLPPGYDYFQPYVKFPAIFPFFYNFDFGASIVTGRNLKYKVTNNKIIITYDRVPKYYPTDANDYATFQVILETTPFCGISNGIITIQYDNTKSGSTFLNRYFDNTISTHRIGIQNNSGNKYVNYRLKTGGQLTAKGPIFSNSPIAVSFNSDNTVLPAEITNFNSLIYNNNVTLNWQTSGETNNSGFDIERSGSDDKWSKKGFVNGAGNSNDPIDYSFTDKNLSPGKYKYRLKQIDFNGNYEYFDLQDEVSIGIPDKFELSQNYPNPFNPVTNLEFEIPELGLVSLKVYDILGKEVKSLVNEIKQAGYYKVQFDGSSFASGVYFYELRSGSFITQKRMLLLK
jgi:photosystem II stability/assembly factor-like uncharacterized protein